MSKYGLIIVGFLVVPWISVVFFGHYTRYFFWGSPEKVHGYFFIIGLLIYTTALIVSPKEHLEKYLSASMAISVLVAFIAIGEFFGGVFDIFSHYGAVFGQRTIATLGNPNYLAGYLLPHAIFSVSFIQKNRNNAKKMGMYIWMCIIYVCAIFTTKSLIGNTLFLVFMMLFVFFQIKKRYIRVGGILLMTTLVLIGWHLIPHDKMLSLYSRFVLQYEGIKMFVQHPQALVAGFGSDAIWYIFFAYRTDLVHMYFSPYAIIDSTHNIWLDIFLQFGLIGGWIVVFCFGKIKKMSPYVYPLIAMMVFFMFNVATLIHYITFILILLLHVKSAPHQGNTTI